MIGRIKNRELTLVFLVVFLFIFVRSVNFPEHLNFSFDQGWTSTRILEIWKGREVTLVGPGSSLVVHGKQILQGSINYYFQLIFLLLGNFDPVVSSYIFMLFTALMAIPLYFGVRLLTNRKSALLILILYSFLPLYVDFTRFFFGPNYQFSLLPILILLMGLYEKRKKLRYLFLIFFMIGILSQFHYATLALFVIIFIYYYLQFRSKSQPAKINVITLSVVAFFGFILGFAPIIVFELKNDFYNIRVFTEYLTSSGSTSNFSLLPHRYINISLILFILVALKFKKYITLNRVLALGIILFMIDLFLYFPAPKKAFGMKENWNYLVEKKAYEIIKKEKLKDFNVANLIYDNLAVVIKYHLKFDKITINYDDYYGNRYLFVIDESEANIAKNLAYEVKTFFPRKKMNQWKLNDRYNLYLFERL